MPDYQKNSILASARKRGYYTGNMSRPGNLDMQYEMTCTYKSNIDMFPAFQEYFRTHQPPALIIWGKYEPYYSVKEAHCYKRDLPNAHIHILNGSHMVLETHFDEVLGLINNFLSEKSKV